MFTFLFHGYAVLHGAAPSLFMGFFVYVWVLWGAKALAARRYRPWSETTDAFTSSVIVPVYDEPEPLFRRVLESIRENGDRKSVV